MRYKKLTLEKIERLKNVLKGLELAGNTNNVQEVRTLTKQVREMVEDIENTVSLEHDSF